MKNGKYIKYLLVIICAGVMGFAFNIQSVFAGETDTIMIQDAASVRLAKGSSGIRYEGTINKNYLQQLENKEGVSMVSYGILVTPKFYLDNVSGFTIDALSKAHVREPYLKIPAQNIIDNGDVYEFRCSMIDLSIEAYEWEFAARSYVEVIYDNGTIEYIYSDFNERTNVNSIKQVAKAVLEDVNQSYTEEEKLILKNYIREDVMEEVYVSSIHGNDENYGTQEEPYATLRQALASVADNGVIVLCDSYMVPSDFEWIECDKTIAITGDTDEDIEVLSFINLKSNVELGTHVIFDNIKLDFIENANVFANGYKLVIGDNVVLGTPINLYGGGNKKAVADTNITVMSGKYYAIYGGGNEGLVLGNTNVVVGGSVNSNIDVSNHSLPHRVYGGGRNSVVVGDTNVTIQDSAQTSVVYGGGAGGPSKVKGTCFINVNGGNVMGYYGGSYQGVVYNTVLNMTAGQVEQIFGGCDEASMTGNANVTITGGTITRRIYGGCYNVGDVSLLGGATYSTDFFVTGNTKVSIGGTINYTHSGSLETAISAGSRHNTNHSAENAVLIIETDTLYNKLKSHIGSSLMEVSGYDTLYVAGAKK